MDLEIINRLYLELSQIATATTEKELKIQAAAEALSNNMHQPSHRPCETCIAMTVALGKRFGCYDFQAKNPR